MPERDRKGLPSGSGAARWLACPGSTELINSFPRIRESSPEAERGTFLHAVLAGTAQLLAGSEDEWMIEACRRIADEFEVEAFGGEKPTEVHVEQVHWLLDPETGAEICSGELDRVAVLGKVACVLDYKTGRVAVTSADANLQLMVYAVLVFDALPYLDEIWAGIIQPHDPASRVLCKYGRGDLEAAKGRVITALRLAAQPGQSRIAGAEQCKWCPAKRECPEHAALAMILAKPAEGVLSVIPDAGELDKIAEAEALWSGYRDARRDAAKAALEANPDAIPGYGLRSTGSISKVEDMGAAWALLAPTIKQADFIAACSLSIPKLVKAFQAATGVKSQKEARANLDALLAETITTTEKARSLVRLK